MRVTQVTGGTCSPVNYTYDSNAVNPSFSQFSQYSYKRLATVQYSLCSGTWIPVTEMYSYHPAGGVVTKQVQFTLCGAGGDNYGCSTGYAEADYTYNSAGQVASYGTYSPTYLNYIQIWGATPPPEEFFTYSWGGQFGYSTERG